MNSWEASVAIASTATDLNPENLRKSAQSPEVEAIARKTTQEFHSLGVSQRPTFLIENDIGDRAVLSGTWTAAPLIGVIDSQLSDRAAYKSWAVHMGNPPTS